MSQSILRAADHRRMPWKNGRGETLEVAVHPQGAGLADFGWRISMAGVVEDGAFSDFPGIDRSLALLGGTALDLHLDGGTHRLTPEGPPLAFAADVPCHASLPAGPVSDLNVMTRRGSFTHRLARLDRPATGAPDWRLLLATRPATLDLAGGSVALGPLDALLCDGSDAAQPLGPLPGVWLIEIARA
ncbi:HutD family protein [Paracoccus sp. (in: a-proteobacteria)]|uniref:HutD/Ves family protein n=1 Tax=Paracoccus sp. TaxID=267 RepID=UPI0032206713